MKNILIFGENSYIGDSVLEYLKNCKDDYCVTTMPSVGVSIQNLDFSSYHSIVYVAGIAHQKETKENVELYYRINRDLACSVAYKAKQQGVCRFILMSSLAVYGLVEGVITKNMKENPKTHYGKSKLQADNKILEISDQQFHVTILRAPMVYGKGCKGNYQRLRSLALKTPVFPWINNKRSMIYIGNLCSYIERVIREDITGIRIPQNENYVCTSAMVKQIAEQHNRRILFFRVPKCFVRIFSINIIKKVFGDLICEEIEDREKKVPDFNISIQLTEKGGASL